MSNPSARAQVARVQPFPLLPTAAAIYEIFGSLYARPLVFEVAMVDGKPAATRTLLAPLKGS